MHVTAIVLAAGKGLRLSRFNSVTVRSGIPDHLRKMIWSGKSMISKPLIKINSQPAIIYCLDILSRNSYIQDIIVVANSKNKKNILNKIRQYHITKIKDVVLGGRMRQDSVLNGLGIIDNHTDLILIHDAARPFIDKETVTSVIKAAKMYDAAIVGVPVKATIKRVAGRRSPVAGQVIVKKTLDRKNLWEIQTPQVFKKDLILKAYNQFGGVEVTDDASLVEKLGARVRIVRGSYSNIKITTPEDLIFAEAIARKGC